MDDLAALPVTLHQLPARQGDLPTARAEGFATGSSPYVTFADPDDRYPAAAADYLRHAIKVLQAHSRVCGVYSIEQQIDASGRPIGPPDRRPYNRSEHHARPSHVHGLIIMRRSDVLSNLHALWHDPGAPEWALTKALAASGQWAKLPYVARLWRRHAGQTSNGWRRH
ncbi:MAG: hypothetical protein AB1479_09925 [Pseudomonadota bacterium]